MTQLRAALTDLSEESRTLVMARAMAEIELDIELEPFTNPADVTDRVLDRLGAAQDFANRMRVRLVPQNERQVEAMVETARSESPRTGLAPCRTCDWLVSWNARACPHCGAPNPVIAAYLKRAYGYEWKSQASFMGYPLVHVAFGRDKNGKMRVAKGVVAIGQFGVGLITFAQIGVGYVVGVGQIVAAPIAFGQIVFGLAAIGQIAIGALYGLGQIASGATAIGEIVLPSLKHLLH
jgi:hypothetical protein